MMSRAWVRGLMQHTLEPEGASRTSFDCFVGNVVHTKVNAYLESYAHDPRATAIIFDILGPVYTSSHFPQLTHEPHLLRPPHLLPELRHTLTKDLESGLLECILQDSSTWHATEAYLEVQHALVSLVEQQTYERSCELNMAREDIIGEILLEIIHGHAFGLPLADETDAQQIFSKPEDDSLRNVFASAPSGVVLPMDRWDQLRRNELEQLLRMCKGKTPPASIRRFLYEQCFYDQDHVVLTQREIVANVKERSARAEVDQEQLVGSTKGADPNVSKINGMLQRLVNESFRVDFADEDSVARRDLMLRVLNQYYVAYGKHFTWNYHLLLPLLFEFEDYKLSDCVYVSMLNQTAHFFGAHGNSLEISGSAVTILLRQDPDLVACIRQNLEQFGSRNSRTVNALIALFAGWIERLFVGVLRFRVVYFLWSQCLLHSVENSLAGRTSQATTKQVLCHACVTVITLLAEEIRRETGSRELERMLVKQAAQIRTLTFTNMFNSVHSECYNY